jgi:hypothetical protein
MRQFDRPGKTLVLLSVVILKTNQEIDSLSELASVCLGLAVHFGDCLLQKFLVDLSHLYVPYVRPGRHENSGWHEVSQFLPLDVG